MLTLYFTYTQRAMRRYFATNRGAKLLTMLGFFAVLLFVETVVHELFFYGFRYVAEDKYFGESIFLYIIELFFLITSLLVFLSALLSGVFSLFRRKNDILLMASPSFGSKIWITFSQMFLSALWPFVVIILPGLAAMWRVYGFTSVGFILDCAASVILIAIATLLALLLILLVSLILNYFTFFNIRRLSFLLFFIALLSGLLLWMRFTGVNLIHFFQARLLDAQVPDLSPILVQFQYLPPHLAALTVFYSRNESSLIALLSLFSLLVITILLFISVYFLSRKFLSVWQRGEESASSSSTVRARVAHRSLLCVQTAKRALLAREELTFLRNPRGLLWLGFILFIWGISNGAGRLVSHGLPDERVASAIAPHILLMIQTGIILYFVAMFVLRFAFPSFSSEQKTSWVVSSSPVNLTEVYNAKWIFFSSLFVFIVLVFGAVNASLQGLAFGSGALFVLSVIVGTLFLTTFGLSLGAIFPNKETDDPERLSTTMPGLGFIFGALLYAFCAGFAMSVFDSYPIFELLYIIATIALSLFFVKQSRRALREGLG